ncbi:MAG: hypothetical protein MJY78_11980 [Fibrobacter sp.]|nr:hypothetical protein [Fibrobacter sp.]
MAMTETKKNVFLGVLTGTLVGFVLGVVFGNPGSEFGVDKGNTSADISKAAKFGKFTDIPTVRDDSAQSRDTVRYEAVDEDGKSMEIIIVK